MKNEQERKVLCNPERIQAQITRLHRNPSATAVVRHLFAIRDRAIMSECIDHADEQFVTQVEGIDYGPRHQTARGGTVVPRLI